MASIAEEFDGPPFQTEIKRISATPEGVIYAPAGWQVVTVAGQLYIKTTDETLNTGWEVVTSS